MAKETPETFLTERGEFAVVLTIRSTGSRPMATAVLPSNILENARINGKYSLKAISLYSLYMGLGVTRFSLEYIMYLDPSVSFLLFLLFLTLSSQTPSFPQFPFLCYYVCICVCIRIIYAFIYTEYIHKYICIYIIGPTNEKMCYLSSWVGLLCKMPSPVEATFLKSLGFHSFLRLDKMPLHIYAPHWLISQHVAWLQCSSSMNMLYL